MANELDFYFAQAATNLKKGEETSTQSGKGFRKSGLLPLSARGIRRWIMKHTISVNVIYKVRFSRANGGGNLVEKKSDLCEIKWMIYFEWATSWKTR